jgi:DNA invertase Pin-like site-specific DNA recombinase
MARPAIAYLRDSTDASELSRLSGEHFDVVAVVRDESPERSGLAEGLGRLSAGEAGALVAVRLGDLADSLRDLVALLDWLAAANATLVALDVGLDTSSHAGQRTVAVLREITRWDEEPRPERPARGRPGLALHAPELSERIKAMRETSLSLQAIADALNAEGIPTQRGGAKWRPSSVQAALGYRRPRPPAPGVPPHPRPHPRHPPHGADKPRPPGKPRPPHPGGRP